MKTYTSKANAKRAAVNELSKQLDRQEVLANFDTYAEVKPQGDAFIWEKKADPEKIAESTSLDGILRKSAVKNPCNMVWEIASEMHDEDPEVRRKDVIAACVAKGVAFYTARTQYQQWKTAMNNSVRK